MGRGPADEQEAVAAAAELDTGAARPPKRRHRVRRIVLIVVGSLLVLVAAALALLMWGTKAPREVSVKEAKERLRASSTAKTVPGVERFHRPPQGVYLFRGSGTEKTSFPPLTEHQGPDMPATVSWNEPGCYTFRIDFNTNHWSDWKYCLTDTGMVVHQSLIFARRDYRVVKIDNTTTFLCDPPSPVLTWNMKPGDHVDGSCIGTNTALAGTTTSAGPYTLVGIEELKIGAKKVKAYRIRANLKATGGQTGGEDSDTWFAASNGLPLKHTRVTHVSTDTPIGAVVYDETAEWQLTSLQPQS